MGYKSYQLRRQVLADERMTHQEKVGALIIIEYTDWHTGVRKFANRKHMENWFGSLTAMTDAPRAELSAAMLSMQEHGYATLTDGVLTLTVQDEWAA